MVGNGSEIVAKWPQNGAETVVVTDRMMAAKWRWKDSKMMVEIATGNGLAGEEATATEIGQGPCQKKAWLRKNATHLDMSVGNGTSVVSKLWIFNMFHLLQYFPSASR